MQSFDEVVENCLRIWFFNYDETADHSGHRVAMREIVKFVTAAKDAEIKRLGDALRPFADIADFMDSETEGFSMTDTLNLVTSDEHFPATIIGTFCLQRFYTARELVGGGSDAE